MVTLADGNLPAFDETITEIEGLSISPRMLLTHLQPSHQILPFGIDSYSVEHHQLRKSVETFNEEGI